MLEIALDMAQSGYMGLTGKAIASIEDAGNLTIVSIDKTMTGQAAIFVLEDDLTIHDAYHLATALCWKAEAFVTIDEELQSKISRYMRTLTPQELVS